MELIKYEFKTFFVRVEFKGHFAVSILDARLESKRPEKC